MPRFTLLLCLALPAFAEEPAWVTVATGAVTVKARPRPDGAVREVWAEGVLAAPVQDLQATLSEMDRFSSFMPYVKSARHVSLEADGSRFNYTELAMPVVSNRDYVVHTWVDEGVQPDGSGTFRSHWVAAPDKVPARSGLVRIKVLEGSWLISPQADGKSRFVYRFVADPGGLIPAWLANYGNQRGVSSTISAIEKEAQRRQRERLAVPTPSPAPSPETAPAPAAAPAPAPASAPALAPAPPPPATAASPAR